MRALVALALWALCVGGCDQFFGTDRIDLPSDSASDPAVTTNHDEDADGRVDADDNCPMNANSDQQDEDGDQVGDVCDPHATQTDTLLLFSAFIPADAGAWTVQNGGLLTDSARLSGTGYIGTTVNGTRLTAVAHMTVPDAGSATEASVFVGDADMGMPRDGIECTIRRNASTFLLLAHQWSGGSPGATQQTTVPIGSGDMQLRASATGECVVSAASTFNVTVPPPTLMGSDVRVGSVSSVLEIFAVSVYGQPP
jgi:hypothetical protein